MSLVAAVQLFGFINVNKPAGMTAHDVVARVRRIAKIKQVGHGGTLDPMATGVLPVAIGKACRLLRFLHGDKTYLAEILLGRQTDTDDVTGATTANSDDIPDEPTVLSTLWQFRGVIQQTPPLYSAVHVGGKRLYELARKGETVEVIPERTVEIKTLEVLSYAAPVLTARIKCTAGTYIRSIARDLGQRLGCGGCLQSLVREEAGPFGLDASYTLEELQAAAESQRIHELVTSPNTVLSLPKAQLSAEHAAQLKLGQAVLLEESSFTNGSDSAVMALHDNVLVAVCQLTKDEAASAIRLQPEVVFL